MLDVNVTSAALPGTYSLFKFSRPPEVQTYSGVVAVVCSRFFSHFRYLSVSLDISSSAPVEVPNIV